MKAGAAVFVGVAALAVWFSQTGAETGPSARMLNRVARYAVAPTGPAASACGVGMWRAEAGPCLAAEVAFTAPEGRTYWVDQHHRLADDRNEGSRDRPWRSIDRASAALSPGDAVLVRAGVYREAITPRRGGTGPDERITYAAYPGEDVVVTGADIIEPTAWRRVGNAWRMEWRGPALPAYSDGDPVMRREMVLAQGEVLGAVSRRSEIVPGTFFAEGTDERPQGITARFPGDAAPDRAGAIEIAHRTFLFRPTGDDPHPDCGDPDTPGWLHVVGFTFRHASNRAQWGTVCAGSEGSLVEDVRIEWTNGAGLDGSGRNHVFRRVASDYNGQIGIVAACRNCLFEDCQTIGNNWKGYDPFWEAGGGKWRDASGTTIRRHIAAANGGPGIWFDGQNASNTIEASAAVGNEVAGIMLELETVRTLVQHNWIARNRWRGYSGSGILSQAASRNVILHNTIIENEGTGLWLRLDPDRRAEDGSNLVLNNALLRNAWTALEEAREITVESGSLGHGRTNRFDGNVYGRREVNDMRTSTFFFTPDPASPAGFRGASLASWQALTGSDGSARLVDESEMRGHDFETPFMLPWLAVPAPGGINLYGAGASPAKQSARVGADPERLPQWVSLSRL